MTTIEHINPQHATVTQLPFAHPPVFEGHDVAMTRVKLTGANNLEVDADLGIDQVVQITIEGVVTGVAHHVDTLSGALVRTHTIKVHAAVTGEN